MFRGLSKIVSPKKASSFRLFSGKIPDKKPVDIRTMALNLPVLPKLIFAQKDFDPVVNRLLTKLIPPLGKLGYTDFYDALEWDVSTVKSLKKTLDNERITTTTLKDAATPFCQASRNVFGKVRLENAFEIQNLILKLMSPEVAASSYCFFNLYSKPIKLDQKHPFLEERVRAHADYHPLGLTSKQVSDDKFEEIAQLILKAVREQKEKIFRLKMRIVEDDKTYPPTDVDQLARALLNAYEKQKEAHEQADASSSFVLR